MSVFKSDLDTRSEAFRNNYSSLETSVSDLREKVTASALGGSKKAREKHTARGKLLPRDRVGYLLDSGSPFLELSQLAGYKTVSYTHLTLPTILLD